MSTVSQRPPSKSPPPPDADPFRYGWRYIRVTQPDGTVVLDQVPLTLEDVLHPEFGDVIVQSDPHDSDLAYLKGVFKVQSREDPGAVVLSDCQVDFNIPGVKPLCPDAALFFGVRRRTEWSSFDVAQEGARAALVVEETSPDTRVNDVVTKLDYYHRAGVPWYVIADVSHDADGRRRIELILHRWRPDGYERIAGDEQGRVWLEPVGLLLGLSRDPEDGFVRLACFDPATGQEVGDYAAIRRALDASQELRADAERRAREAQARADAERRTREDAQARADAERARADAERHTREEIQARAADAERRAQEEAQARADAERRARADATALAEALARIRELEARPDRSGRADA